MSAMASSLFSALIIINLLQLIIISSDAAGRWSSLQKNIDEIGIRVRAVSHATTYTGKTNFTDVVGLAKLCDQFPLLEEANLDPCLPPVWSWIECNADPLPRITALNLGSRVLYGTLPDFSMMDALESIDLQQNSLYGPIPSFLGDFPHLQKLNLAYNLFTGQVPDSLACNTNLKLSLDGNYGLYTSNSCPSGRNTAIPTTQATPLPDYSGDNYVYTTTTYRRRKSRTPIVVGSTVSTLAVIGIAVGIFAIFRHKAKVAAAVAAANAQGPNDEQNNPAKFINTHTGETPINPRPTNLS